MYYVHIQLWEEDGLDLALIPYGCIATGPDSGFIEVVKNARTIAEVGDNSIANSISVEFLFLHAALKYISLVMWFNLSVSFGRFLE